MSIYQALHQAQDGTLYAKVNNSCCTPTQNGVKNAHPHKALYAASGMIQLAERNIDSLYEKEVTRGDLEVMQRSLVGAALLIKSFTG
jgi:hypothetical protein